MTAAAVLTGLKVAVVLATLVLATALVALARGKPKAHGKLNLLFVTLTLLALFFFEVVIRFISPGLMKSLWADPEIRWGLTIHLSFSIPAALLMLSMLATGTQHRTKTHKILAPIFLICWMGTVVTGLLYLPSGHSPAGQNLVGR